MNITLSQSEILLILQKHLKAQNIDVKTEDIELTSTTTEVIAIAKQAEFKTAPSFRIDNGMGNGLIWPKNTPHGGVITPYIQENRIEFGDGNINLLNKKTPKKERPVKIDGEQMKTPVTEEDLSKKLGAAYDFFKPHFPDAQTLISTLTTVQKAMNADKK